MRKNCLTKKTPPPPPRNYFFYTKFFFNVGNSMKREENMKYMKYLQSFEKIHRCVFELQLKTKRD